MCGHSNERTLSDFILSQKEYLNHMISDSVRLYAIYVLLFRPARNSRRFSRAFHEKPKFYDENPIAQRFGMGFSHVTIHALDRACIVTR